MNPELPTVQPTPESMPQIPGSVEYQPDGLSSSPEREQAPSRVETSAAPIAPPVIQPVPASLPVPPVDTATNTTPVDDDMPLLAEDSDVIEKEWVDKVKKIIILTKNNPYERAKVIAQLQADYLKKRYNKDLGGDSE